MQGFELIQYFEDFPELKKHFNGIYSIDTLPSTIKFRTFCICNTDFKNGFGKHWICFLRNSLSQVECFDSLGLTDDKKQLILTYCKFKQKTLLFNESQFQKNETDSCGLFCIYFLFERYFNLSAKITFILYH